MDHIEPYQQNQILFHILRENIMAKQIIEKSQNERHKTDSERNQKTLSTFIDDRLALIKQVEELKTRIRVLEGRLKDE